MPLRVMPSYSIRAFCPDHLNQWLAMCALTTARAMWQRISRYGVTMPGSVFEIT
jgi:hypothetical protein